MRKLLALLTLALLLSACGVPKQLGPSVPPPTLQESPAVPEDSAWRAEAKELADQGYLLPAGFDKDLETFNASKERVATWEAARERLLAAFPILDGDAATVEALVSRLGLTEVGSQDIENRHTDGQLDQMLRYGSASLSASVYKANLNPVKYLTLEVTVTGKIGIAEVDDLLGMSVSQLSELYGETKMSPAGSFALGPVKVGRLTDLSCKLVDGKVESVVYTGYID